jgi:hypothetical protein
MVIAVWLTLNVSADATGLLELPGPGLVDTGSGYRPVSHSIRTSSARSADASSQSMGARLAVRRGLAVRPMPRRDSSARSRTNAPVVTMGDGRTMSITSRR